MKFTFSVKKYELTTESLIETVNYDRNHFVNNIKVTM